MFDVYPENTSILFPERLICGDSWQFFQINEQYAQGSDDGPWVASLTFATGLTKITTQATVSGARFEWAVPAIDTALLTPGPVGYTVSVSNGVLRRTIETGAVRAVADITSAGVNVNASTMLEQMLSACDSSLLALLSQTTSLVSFAGKQYQLWNIKELWEVRNALYARVVVERAVNDGNSRSRHILPIFVNR